MSNIVEVVVSGKNPATMLRSMKATELAAELSKIGPFAIFAPSNLAFRKLAPRVMTELLKPENQVMPAAILYTNL